MTFKSILADPPWNYSDSMCRGGVGRHYPTMHLDDIMNLPVKDISDPDGCHLYLWSTWPMIRDGNPQQVMEAWGFRWVSEIVWVKLHGTARRCHWNRRSNNELDTDLFSEPLTSRDEIIIRPAFPNGHRFRKATEVLLVGERGKCRWDYVAENGEHRKSCLKNRSAIDVIFAASSRHSRKPDNQYQIIERCSDGPYCELFATKTRDGWVSWGNQVESDSMLSKVFER